MDRNRLTTTVASLGRAQWPFLVALLLHTGIATVLLSASPGHSGDTIEFQFLADSYGVPHPPGAPFYVIVLWAWRHILFFVTPALAANLLSFAAGLAVLAGADRLLRQWKLSNPAIFLCLLTILCSQLWLTLTSVAELYVPALAAIVWFLSALEAWAVSGRGRNLVLASTLMALATGIHALSVLAAPAGAIILTRRSWRDLLRPQTCGAFCVYFAGLVLGITVVLLAATDPSTPFVWSRISDMDSAVRFLTAASFHRHFGAMSPTDVLAMRIPAFLDSVLPGPFWMWVLWFAPLFLRWRDRRVWTAFALLGTNACYVVSYDVGDVWDFVLPGQVAVALLIALGVDGWRPLMSRSSPRRARLVVPIVVILSSVAHATDLPTHIREANRVVSDRTYVERARRAINLAGPNAVIVSPSWSDSCAFWYELLAQQRHAPDFAFVHNPRLVDLAGYVRGQTSLSDVQRRRVVGPGRDVFVLRQNYLQEFLDEGFFVYSLDSEFHLVRSQRDSTIASRWPQIQIVEHDPFATRVSYGAGWGSGEKWGRWMLETRAALTIENPRGGGRLRIQASLWDSSQDPARVSVRRAGVELGSFTVDTAPWDPHLFVVPIPTVQDGQPGEIEIEVDSLHTADRDRPRALAVQAVEWATGARR